MTKVALIGTGMVGRAAALAITQRGSCDELLLIDQQAGLATAVALDIRYGIPFGPPVGISAGDWPALAGTQVAAICAGTNELQGGAADPNDPDARFKLIDFNATVIADIVGQVVRFAPQAVLLIVTNPPDPLADLALDEVRRLGGQNPVLSAGTVIDTLRFRAHIAEALHVGLSAVTAQVIGAHGKPILHWSAVSIAGVPLADFLRQRNQQLADIRTPIQERVRAANTTIIQGLKASQYGIGIITARLAEAILRNERLVVPVGSRHPSAGISYCLPSVLGSAGVQEVLPLSLDAEERQALDACIDRLRRARDQVTAAVQERRR